MRHRFIDWCSSMKLKWFFSHRPEAARRDRCVLRLSLRLAESRTFWQWFCDLLDAGSRCTKPFQSTSWSRCRINATISIRLTKRQTNRSAPFFYHLKFKQVHRLGSWKWIYGVKEVIRVVVYTENHKISVLPTWTIMIQKHCRSCGIPQD